MSYIPVNAVIQFAEPPLKEGVYRVNTFTTPLNEINYIENTSNTYDVYFVVFNENDTLIQSIKLPPNSSKHQISPLDPSYKIVIIRERHYSFIKRIILQLNIVISYL